MAQRRASKVRSVRRGCVERNLLGTRVGRHERLLVSSGLAELDRLVGGGFPLGALVLVTHVGLELLNSVNLFDPVEAK